MTGEMTQLAGGPATSDSARKIGCRNGRILPLWSCESSTEADKNVFCLNIEELIWALLGASVWAQHQVGEATALLPRRQCGL